jgi:ABC-type glycerol-3-phosphate transport system substrate-binding protein
MSKFQLILLVVFGAFIVIAVMVFAFAKNSGTASASVTVWGAIPQYEFDSILTTSQLKQSKTLSINYEEKSPDTIERDFTEALALGGGPDLIILPQEILYKEKNKIIEIPYKSYKQKTFTDTFIQEGELYLTDTGVMALPLYVDPMVLYYNRDILSNAGVAKPLAYWDELYAAALALNKKDGAGNITQSVVALGEARNIANFKEILSLLMLQAGTPLTGYIGTDLRSQISNNLNLPIVPAEAALDFYTQFSNPSKPYYSWNRSLPEAQNRFTSGNTAYYLGFASELKALRNKNPTLNFSLTTIPQSRVSSRVVTYGRLYGLSISRGSRNPTAALQAATLLTSAAAQTALVGVLAVPPVRRDLLGDKSADAALAVFYNAALQSKGWIDPNSTETRTVFREMIESVTSGRARTSEAVRKASEAIDSLITQ